MENPISLLGMEFIEYAAKDTSLLRDLFKKLGFYQSMKDPKRSITLYRQNDIRFLVNTEPNSFAFRFTEAHGPAAPAMGWRVKDAKAAREIAVSRGARPAEGDYRTAHGPVPAIYGIGDSLIYFIDDSITYESMGFAPVPGAKPTDKGFLRVDHLTNNVPNGTMGQWADFYKKIFGFTEVRYFDIKGKKTGLQSFALRSPCGTFCIPINEAKEEKSQINEYLREYKGAGIQHIALLTNDILASLKSVRDEGLPMLEIDPSYYDEAFRRVPQVTEDRKTIQELGVLIDGDPEGYLLQIFTQNAIGPIFFEIIQRKNHQSFGEGNFGALFRSIEADQEKRGTL
jgi:4-hydroxyphenylpyruvate dioxygenase